MQKLNRHSGLLLMIVYLAFISLGLPDGVMGVAWPAIRAELGLALESMGLLTTLLLLTSAFSSFASGRLIARFGTGRLTFISALMTSLALLGYRFAPSFLWLLLLTLPLGFGQGAVDSGLNLFVAAHYSSRQMNWLHCFWGVGASLGPLIMAYALRGGITGWRAGYLRVSLLQQLLTVVLLVSLLAGLWRKSPQPARDARPDARPGQAEKGLADPLSQWLAILFCFLYTGIEFTLGYWLGSVLTEARQLPAYYVGLMVTVYYASIMTGRFLSGLLVGRLGNQRMIQLGMALAFVGLTCVFLSGGQIALLFASSALCGLGLAPCYPCSMHETPARFQKSVSDRLIGYQVGSACLGGSLIPACTGLLLSRVSLELLFPVVGALLLAAFAINQLIARRAACAAAYSSLTFY